MLLVSPWVQQPLPPFTPATGWIPLSVREAARAREEGVGGPLALQDVGHGAGRASEGFCDLPPGEAASAIFRDGQPGP